MTEFINTVITGDCLIESDKIPSGSVDLILTDLPYGNMKNAPSTWDKSKTEWDLAIEPSDIYSVANRILRKNGKMVLFSQEPYTTRLINEAIPNVPFSYRAIWEKDSFANALGVNKNMVGIYEDILIFSKKNEKEDFESKNPVREWFCDEFKKSGYKVAEINSMLGNSMASHYFTKGSQFRFPTAENFSKLHLTGFFKRDYEELKIANDDYRKELLNDLNTNFPSVFNLWEGNKYKTNILRHKKDYNGYHPTQKPVLLLEDLIKTFSNEGDTVVDLTAGSGSTAVAAVNTKRNFIAIEQDAKYADIARQRISDAMKTEVNGGAVV